MSRSALPAAYRMILTIDQARAAILDQLPEGWSLTVATTTSDTPLGRQRWCSSTEYSCRLVWQLTTHAEVVAHRPADLVRKFFEVLLPQLEGLARGELFRDQTVLPLRVAR